MVRLFTLAVIPILALCGDLQFETPTWSGSLPGDWGRLTVLDTSHTPLFLVDRGDRVAACTLHSGKYVTKYDLPRLGTSLRYWGDSAQPCGFNLIGDVDDDGIEEFAVAVNRTISKYKLINGTLALTSVASIRLHPDSGRMWITDGCIGDINNDRRNEILVAAAGSKPPSAGGDSWSIVTLFVCRWDGDSLVQMWNDQGKLNLELPPIDLPTEEMCTIADIRNIGINKLILLEGTGDDVHPAVYRELVWKDGGLREAGFFQLRDDALQPEQWPGELLHAATGCGFGQVNGKTAILADIETRGCILQGELFVFSGDSTIQHRVLWSDADLDLQNPSMGTLIDPDGKGVGALRIMNPWTGGARFEFYRL